MAGALRPANNDFEALDHGHQDIVTVISYNLYGKRRVTGSTDHRLKVFDRQLDASWKLIDTWRGHDAEILDAKWSTPFMGQIIGSIGEDQKFKVWEEDVYEPPNSGHRFKCIFTLQSPSRIPYVSFDFKTVNYSDMHVALLSRDALLTIYEADEPESMASWALVDQFHVCTPPVRGEETAFKVQFDPNSLPCWAACRAGVREDSLALVTAGMNTVKIWRTSSLDRHFYLAADLSSAGHRSLVRDIAWAPLNIRGWDLIAATYKDGAIRIFEVHYPHPAPNSSSSSSTPTPNPGTVSIREPASFNGASGPPSRIGASLAGQSKMSNPPTTTPIHNGVEAGHVAHSVKPVATIQTQQYGGVWQAKWRSAVFEGMELITTHDDGSLRVWKNAAAVGDGSTWLEFAAIETDGNS